MQCTRHVFKVRSGLKLPPIVCTVRESACAGSYMCSLANVCHFVSGRSLFYVKKDWIKMCAAINNPASCEVRAVIRFLLARNNNAAEIHSQLCEGYGPNVMSDSKVRQWCHFFKEVRTNVYDAVGLVSSQTIWWKKWTQQFVEIVALQFPNCPSSFHEFQDQRFAILCQRS